MIWYHTRVSTSTQSCFTITANDLVTHKGQHEQTVLHPHYSQRSVITQGSAWSGSLASPLQPKIWYHTRVSPSRQSCFTITANNLLSHKSQHEQTVLLSHYCQWSGITQGSARADSLASPLQPMIWYHTRVSKSRQSCFTITANDLVPHKGQQEQTVLLHHFSQWSGFTQGSAWADSLASPLQPKIWYHTRVSPSRQSCFTITANNLLSHKSQHEQTVLLSHYSQWSAITQSTSRQSCFTITANDLLSHKGQHEQTVLLHHNNQWFVITQESARQTVLLHHYSQWSDITQGSAWSDGLALPLQQKIWYHTRASPRRQPCFTITAIDLESHKGQHEQTALLHHYCQWSGITQGSARAGSLSSPLQTMIWYHTRVSMSRQSCFPITAKDWYHIRVSPSRQFCFNITAYNLLSHKSQHEQTVLLHHYSQWSGIT